MCRGKINLRLLPLAMRSSTEVCKLPASSSCTVSHERANDASQVYACYNISIIVLILSSLANLLYLLLYLSSCLLSVYRWFYFYFFLCFYSSSLSRWICLNLSLCPLSYLASTCWRNERENTHFIERVTHIVTLIFMSASI